MLLLFDAKFSYHEQKLNRDHFKTEVFSYFVCFVQSSLSEAEGNDVICDIEIADHVENSLPNKFMTLI